MVAYLETTCIIKKQMFQRFNIRKLVLLDLNGLTEIRSYCSEKWVELHSAKFVWMYYPLIFDLINIPFSLSYA